MTILSRCAIALAHVFSGGRTEGPPSRSGAGRSGPLAILAVAAVAAAAAPGVAAAQSAACQSINNNQIAAGAGNNAPGTLSGTYSIGSQGFGGEQLTSTNWANFALAFTPGEIISYSYNRTSGSGYVHVLAQAADFSLRSGSLENGTAASGSGSITVGASNDTLNIALTNHTIDTAGGNTGSGEPGRNNSSVDFTISCASPPSPPTLNLASPNVGLSTGGGAVVITGNNLTGATAVTFGGTPAQSFIVDNANQITAVAPAHAEGDVNVVVTTPGGSATLVNGYIFVLKPTITAINPPTGPPSGGSFTATITGTNFVSGQMTAFFDGIPANGFVVLNSTTLAVSPPAHAAGAVNVTVTKRGVAADQTLTYTYAAPTITVGPENPANQNVGQATNQAFTASGGTAPYTWALASGSLPAGITLNAATGALTGTGTEGGLFNFTLRATDSSASPGPYSGTKSYSLLWQGAIIGLTNATPPDGQVDQPYSHTFGGSGGTAPYQNFVVTGGSLPPGLTLNGATGVLSGTPTTPGTYAGLFIVTQDSSTGTGPYTGGAGGISITIAPPPVPTASSFTFGSIVPYNDGSNLPTSLSVAFAATNNPTGYAVGSATTAQGGLVSIDNTGQVSYTPPTGFRGNDAFTYTASNTGGTSSPATVMVSVGDPALSISLTGGGREAVLLTGVAVEASGGAAPYSCTTSPSSGSLPNGVSINSDCTLGGAPSGFGSFNFTVDVTDSSTGTGPFTQTSGTLTLNIDAMPELTIGDATSNEGTDATFTFSLNAPAGPGGVSFDVATYGNTATNADFMALNAHYVIPEGDTSYSVAVTHVADGVYEADESYDVMVTNVSGATLADGEAVGTIVNTDSPPLVLIGDVSQSEGDSGTTVMTFTVSLSGPSALPASVIYSTADATAMTPGDYAAASGTVNFAPFEMAQTVTILVNGDTTAEPDETFLLNLDGVSGAFLTSSSVTGTIINDDAPPAASISAVSVTEGAEANFTVTLDKPAGPGGATIDITVSDGTAFSPGDFTGVFLDDVMIPEGYDSVAFTVLTTADNTYEADEYFVVELIDLNGVTAAVTSVQGTILNDDAPPALSVNDVTLVEGNAGTTAFTFTVSLDAPSGLAVTVDYGSAAVTATEGSDFTGVSGSLTFTPGQTALTATVLVNGDTAFEPNETFALNLSSPDQATLADNQGIGTIVNDDLAAPSAPVTITPINGSTIGDNTPIYSGTGEAGSTITVIVDGAGMGTTTADGAGNWTIAAAVPLADGPHSVRSTATNGGGTSPSSNTNTFTVDTTPPAAPVVNAPADGSSTTSQTPAYSGTAESNSTITVIVDGSAIGTTTAGGAGAWSLTQPTPLTLAAHTVRASATDLVGNTSPSSSTNSFTVTPFVPVAGSVSATVAYGSTNNPITLNVSGGAADSVAVAVQATHGVATASGASITYTPTAGYAGPDSFTYTATNGGGTSSPAQVTVTVSAPTLILSPSVPSASVGVAYSYTLAASGGAAPYSYAVTAGALPAGLTLSSGGVLSGTATAAGSFDFTITATDSSTGTGPFTASRAYTLGVAAPTISVSPMSATATVGAPFSNTFSAIGGTAPYSFAVTAGSLPAGMGLSSTGVLSGTATAGGTFNFTVTATDSSTGVGAPYSGSRSYALTVNAASIVLPTASLPSGALTAPYSAQLPSASGGTGPYGYVLTGGSMPTGLTLSPSGLISGAATAGGTFNFSVTATDSSTGTGPYTATQAYSVTIAAPTIAVGPTTLPEGTKAIAYTPQTITASGGVAPYSYAVTAGGLPPGMTVSPAGVLSGTPTDNGTFNFTVTATDSATGNGPYSGARAYSLVIALDPPTANDVSVSVAYGSVDTPVTLNLTGGAPNSLAIGTAPAHGTVTVSGLSITYTPAAGYYGADSFTYTATNGSGTSAPATVSVTVGLPPAPTAADRPGVAVPYQSSGVAIDLSGSITGVHSSIAMATAPAHGTVSVAGDVVTYTPTAGYYGADAFTYTATGPGGTSNAATVTLTVATPPAPTATGTSVAVPYDGAGTAIDLSARISGVSSSISVATAPAHGTTSVAGNVVTYTPAAGFYGADSFTYTANGPGGSSAPATVSLTVATPPPPVVTPTSPPAVPPTTGGSSTVDLQAQVGGVVTGWRITIAPTHGTAVIEGAGPAPAQAMPNQDPQASGPALTLRYTPTAGSMGTDTVTLVAEGPGGDSAPVTFTFQVPGMAPNRTAIVASNAVSTIDATSGVTGGPFSSVQITRAPGFGTAVVSGLNIVFTPGAANSGPTYLEYTITTPGGVSAVGRIDYQVNLAPGAQILVANTPAGVPVTVSLTANAVGGPFTGAAITSLSIPNAGTAVLTEGGVAGNRTYTVTFTPTGTFTGRVDVRFTLTNAFATEAGVVQVNVTPRADPSLDPDVRGLVTSQVESTRRFARAQTDNFNRRLEQLRDGTNDSSSNLSLNLNMGGQSEIDPRAAARRRLGDQQVNEDGLGMMETRARDDEADAFAQFRGRNGRASAETVGAAPAALGVVSARQAENGGSGAGSVGVWAGGSIDWGRRDVDNQRDTRFTTSGVSAGVDVKVADGLIVGAGLGYGEDRARIGANDTTSDGTSYIGAVYAAAKGPTDLNFEAVLGYGSLSYDSRRWSAAASAFAFGEREGDMMFGSIGLAQDHKWTGVSSSIYGRIEGQSVTLDAFTETGAGIHSLTYDAMDFDAFSSTLGMRLNWRIERRDMVFTPSLRMEWAHEFSDTGVQTVSYADWIASPRYGLTLDDWARDRFQLGLEGRWMFDTMELSAGYRGSASSNTTSHGVEFKLTTRF